MQFKTPRARRVIAVVTLAAGLAACDNSITNPKNNTHTRVAVATRDGGIAALYLQDVDGSNRTRIHFANVTDAIGGNAAVLISDTSVHSLGTPVWDPTGTRVAVAAEVSDRAMILVMRADGSGGQVASLNTLLIGCDPEWSSDGRQIAYTMNTFADFDAHEIYTTDLVTNTVARVTTDARAVGATVRWSPDGLSIVYSRNVGSTREEEPDNILSDVIKVDASSGEPQTLAASVVGQITSIARTGNRVLLSRAVATGAGDSRRELVELTIGGSERVLVENTVWYGRYVSGNDALAMLATSSGTGSVVTNTYEILDLASRTRTTLGGVTGQAAIDIESK